jgi:tetratricopeptide (TPR) repeat protein
MGVIMKGYIIFPIIFFVVFTSGMNSLAQDSWMEDILDKVALMTFEERFEEAIQLLEEALETAKKKYGEVHQNYGDLNKELAGLYLTLENFAEAEQHFQIALNTYMKAFGPEEYEVGEGHIDLATVYEMQEKWAFAETHLSQGMKVLKKNLEADDPYMEEIESRLVEVRAIYRAEKGAEKSGEKELIKVDITRKEKELLKVKKGIEKKELAKIEAGGMSGFEILDVKCPKTAIYDKKSKIIRYPVLKVTYKLITTKDQVNWEERVEVFYPDGRVLEAGGGRQWYVASRHGDEKTYSVNGYCTPRIPGTYKYRLTLEGKDTKTQVIERSFEIK